VKQLLKDGEVSEDEDKRAEKEIQQLTDKSIAEIDRIVAEKEKDLMAV
jgi:ribosome recycling factor